MRNLYGIMAVIVCGALQASEYFKGYDVDQPRVSTQPTQRALDYERAYNKDSKERIAGFYNRLKSALGFKATAPRPRVAEYEAAFSPYSEQRNAPWNTPWYETRTYEDPLPYKVKKALDEHQKELVARARVGDKVVSFEWLPGYIVKLDRKIDSNYLNRIEGAKTFTSAIKEARDPAVYVPQKYEYSLEYPDDGIRIYYAISEKVPESKEPITKEEAAAIAKIAYRTKWTDAHARNLMKMAPGRIAIIDTEPWFSPELQRHELKRRVDVEMLRYPRTLSPEAINYLRNKYTKHRYKDEGRYFSVPPSKKSFYSRMGL